MNETPRCYDCKGTHELQWQCPFVMCPICKRQLGHAGVPVFLESDSCLMRCATDSCEGKSHGDQVRMALRKRARS